MTQVVYGQKGYLGSSMSVRAAEAYEQGEMPISRWTKTAIIQAVKDYCFDFDLAYDPDIEKKTKAELAKEFLEYKSWHHSSRTAREVEFFGLNEDAVCRSFEQMSEEQIIERDRQMADERAALEARLQFMQSREKEFKQKFECDPSSVLAYEAIHPEMCERFISRRKKAEMIKYRLPTELTPEGQFHSKKNIPKDQWVRTVGHHPAIIDDELLRRELKARKEAGAHNLHEQKKNFPPGIFGKEVRCASCGKILTKGKTLRKTGYERTLFCPTRKKSPSHCKGAFISEKHLESAILHELKNLADRYSDDRVQIGICQDAQSADLIQERNRLKTAVELIEKEITAYEQRSRDLYLKRATDGMSIDDFNSALSRIRNDVDKLRLKSKHASSELLHLNESIAAESIRMETVLKAADFNHLDKTKVSMLIESVYVHKRDPKSGTQAIDITWKF